MGTIRVMIFDDDLVDQQGFLAPVFVGLQTLVGDGFRIETTYRAHADAAVAEVAAWGPTLVFMDFQMLGHASGDVAIAALREVHDHGALPILAISSDARFNRLLLGAGATESCPKMALPNALPDLLARLLAVRA